MNISRNTVYKFEGEIRDKASIILQLNTLFSTPVGSAALDRDFGLDMTAIDLPLPIAQARISAEIIDKVPKYIPDIRVKEVLFEAEALTGELRMEVIIKNV